MADMLDVLLIDSICCSSSMVKNGWYGLIWHRSGQYGITMVKSVDAVDVC